MKKTFSLLLLFASVLVACGPKVTDSTTTRELEDLAKLEAQYNEVAGLYRGTITSDSLGVDPYPVEIKISVVYVQDGVNENRRIRYRPELRGNYRRLDLGDEASFSRALRIQYYKEENKIGGQRIIMDNYDQQSAPGQVPGSNFFSINATFEAGRIIGRATDKYGPLGTLSVERQSQF